MNGFMQLWRGCSTYNNMPFHCLALLTSSSNLRYVFLTDVYVELDRTREAAYENCQGNAECVAHN